MKDTLHESLGADQKAESSDENSNELDTQLDESYRRCRQETQGTSLMLSKLQLSQFPTPVGSLFPSLRSLSVRCNQLSALPDNFAEQFPLLHTLDLSSNLFDDFPVQICSLIRLHKLFINNNQIVELPSALAQLINLEELHVRSNNIYALPDEIGTKLHRLRVLQLAHNQLERIPSSFSDLQELTVVDLSGNVDMKAAVPERIRRLHERNEILHSRSKRRELITRALRVRSGVSMSLSVHAASAEG